MGNIRITFEIPEKVINKLENSKGFIKELDKKKANRELSPYIVDLLIRDFEKREIINIDTEKIAQMVSKEIIKEIRKLNININGNTSQVEENIQELDEDKKNKLKQLA